ncbi:MAG: LysR family transcriptional regulator [Gammaproteobacteria bacterium]|nr:LysR family transcriptional regulator [Gammaproteobacteria bacterium]
MAKQNFNRMRQLRAFCSAAQLSSISKAAEQLELSQPSVSLQIQGLEQELNVQLFERRGPKIRLTPAGDTLLKMAIPLIDGVERLPEAFASELGNLEGGTLDIASGQSTLLYLLPDHVKAFKEQYQGINVRLHSVTGRNGMAMLRSDDVDFAVGSMLDVPDDMVFHPIFRYETMCIMKPGHPLADVEELTLEQIGQYGLILPPSNLTTFKNVELVFQQNQVKYNVALEVGGWEVIKRYVRVGLGIGIVTSICLRDDDQLVRRSVAKYFPERVYGVVVRRGKFLSTPAKAFLQMMAPQVFGNITRR